MDRKLRILMAVVDEYISTGEPVGSKALANMFGNVSSATIRNDMALLCELGFLSQPHTSAGRVPTVRGYRAYVDSLTALNPAPQTRRKIDDAVANLAQGGEIYENAGRTLSELTGLPALSAAEYESDRIAGIRVLPLSDSVSAVLVVTASGRVTNSAVRCTGEIPRAATEKFVNAANAAFTGRPLGEVTAAAVQSMAMELGEHVFRLTGFLEGLVSAAQTLTVPQVSLSGEGTLFSMPDYDLVQLRELMRMMADHAALSRLLLPEREGVNVFIGHENLAPQLAGSSLLTACYGTGEMTLGRLGVIAPIRVDYKTVIPAMEYFSEKIGKLLSQPEGEEE